MNWEAIGAIAEILGALAVFLSLVYLAIQTRNNTRALRSAAFHQVRESFSEVSLVMVQNPEIANLVNRAIKNDPDLSDDEILRFNYFLTTLIRRGESAYFQSSDGALQFESWLGIKVSLLPSLSSGYGIKWWENSSQRFTKEYGEALRKALIEKRLA